MFPEVLPSSWVWKKKQGKCLFDTCKTFF
jgi:hypothetical protein